MWQIRIKKSGATWYWFTENPQGGGLGSNYCGPKHIAMFQAMRNMPDGANYTVKSGPFTRRAVTLERRGA